MSLIKVKVFPGAKKEAVIRKSADSFEIKVKAEPTRGQANNAVLEVLSAHLKIPRSKIRIIKGHKTRNKIISVSGTVIGETKTLC